MSYLSKSVYVFNQYIRLVVGVCNNVLMNILQQKYEENEKRFSSFLKNLVSLNIFHRSYKRSCQRNTFFEDEVNCTKYNTSSFLFMFLLCFPFLWQHNIIYKGTFMEAGAFQTPIARSKLRKCSPSLVAATLF